MKLSSASRPAFTLLEVLLASAIAVLLMAALYVGMDVQLSNVQAGREKVNETNLVRNLIARMSADAVGTLTPLTATVAVTSTTGDTTTDPVTPFNGGVQGDGATLTLWVSRLPQLATGSSALDADSQQLNSSDLRRITYWVAGGGLSKQEIPNVSASTDDPDFQSPPPDDPKYLLAPEVTEMTLQYFDGESWQPTWDGTALGADGITPIGPPRAIEVVLSIRPPNADPNDANAVKQYRQVIPLNTGNGPSVATASTTSGTTGTTGSTTTGGTSP